MLHSNAEVTFMLWKGKLNTLISFHKQQIAHQSLKHQPEALWGHHPAVWQHNREMHHVF